MILAGGRGSRMHPLSEHCPKPLLPVGPWTLIEHQIAALQPLTPERIVLSTGYRHGDFAQVIETLRAKGVHLTAVVETSPQGTGGGLRAALRALPGTESVIVLNGDLLSGHDLCAQVQLLQAAPAQVLASIHVRQVLDARPYGSVLIDPAGRITDFVEKSARPPSRLVNAGTYVVRPEILDAIPSKGPVSLERDVFPQLARAGALMSHEAEGYFLDVGSPAALITANRDLLLNPWPGAVRSPQGEALILPGASVDPTAALSGGSVVHPGARIEAGARLDSSLVLTGAHIGAGAEATRSVIGPRAQVGPQARLIDAALGAGVCIAAGEVIVAGTRPPHESAAL